MLCYVKVDIRLWRYRCFWFSQRIFFEPLETNLTKLKGVEGQLLAPLGVFNSQSCAH